MRRVTKIAVNKAKRVAEKHGITDTGIEATVSYLAEGTYGFNPHLIRKLKNEPVLIAKSNSCMLFTAIDQGIVPLVYINNGKYTGSILRCTHFTKLDSEKSQLVLSDGTTTITKTFKDISKKWDILLTPVSPRFVTKAPTTKPKPHYTDLLGQTLNPGDIVVGSYTQTRRRRNDVIKSEMIVATVLKVGWPAGKIKVQDIATKNIKYLERQNCCKVDKEVDKAVLKYKLSH